MTTEGCLLAKHEFTTKAKTMTRILTSSGKIQETKIVLWRQECEKLRRKMSKLRTRGSWTWQTSQNEKAKNIPRVQEPAQASKQNIEDTSIRRSLGRLEQKCTNQNAEGKDMPCILSSRKLEESMYELQKCSKISTNLETLKNSNHVRIMDTKWVYVRIVKVQIWPY